MQKEEISLPNAGFVRLHQILKVFPVSPSTWWAGVKSGRFPRPIKLGANTTAWKAHDINKLIERAERGTLAASGGPEHRT